MKILPVKKKFTHCTTPTEERDPLDTSSSSLEQNNDHPVQKVLLKKDPRLSAKIPLKLTQCPGGKITLAPAVRSEKQCSSPEDTANKNPQSTDKIPMKKISKVTSDKTIESKVSGNITQTLQVEFVDMDYVKPSPMAAKKQTRYSTKYNLKKIANLTNKAPMDKLTQCSGGRVTLTPREEHDNEKSVDSETQTE